MPRQSNKKIPQGFTHLQAPAVQIRPLDNKQEIERLERERQTDRETDRQTDRQRESEREVRES